MTIIYIPVSKYTDTEPFYICTPDSFFSVQHIYNTTQPKASALLKGCASVFRTHVSKLTTSKSLNTR